MAREEAEEHGLRIFPTVTDALRLGGGKLARELPVSAVEVVRRDRSCDAAAGGKQRSLIGSDPHNILPSNDHDGTGLDNVSVILRNFGPENACNLSSGGLDDDEAIQL